MKSLFLMMLLFSAKVWACEIQRPEKFALATSPKEGLFFAYDVNHTLHEIPYFRAVNCEKIAMRNKFLMIAFGPQNIEFSDRIGVYDFANDYKDSGCYIKNNPFKKILSFADRHENLQQRWKYIKSCYDLHVEEESNLPLNMPANQPGCTYQRHGKNKMSFNGGFCFLKPGFGSSYILKFEIKQQCKTQEGLDELNLTIADLETNINFYASGDATGNSVDLTALSTFPLRTTIAPDGVKIPASDNFGIQTPQFPGDFNIPDIHLGAPETNRVQENRVFFRLPLWVDNNCGGPCGYAQPIAGSTEYYELENQTETFITSWFDGGVVQPKYQGEIATTGFELPTEMFQVGRSYRVKTVFNDPKFDFERFKNRIKTRLATMNQDLGQLNRGQIRIIPETPRIGTIQTFPTIDVIPGMSFGTDNFSSVDNAVEALRNILGFKLWPPYFEKICNGSACHGVKDDYLTLSMDFKVESYNEEDRAYVIKVIKTERKSALLPSYVKENPTMPEVACPY
jgi:hypothetical protein